MPQYSGVWNLAQQSQALNQQQWVTDPNFKNTTLLLQADAAANGSQNNTFIDSSGNSFPITRNGNTTQGSFTPFSQAAGYWGNYFGGSGNYAVSNAAVITSSTTTFTIEGWMCMTAAPVAGSNNPSLIGDMQPTGSANYWSFGPLANGTLCFYWFDGSSKYAIGNTVMALNTWYHIAVSVNANAISLYVNGVQQTITGTTTLTNRSGSTSTVSFAQFATSSSVFTGYISNFSVLSGTAKYSSSFTPTTSPLATNTTNQVLLFAYGNRFADFNTATTAKTFTITGSSVQAFGPFTPQYQYTTPVIGGSGYFDGNADYLTVPAGTQFRQDQGDWTLEGFFYITSFSTSACLFSMGSFSSADNFTAYVTTTGKVGYEAGTGGWSAAVNYETAASLVRLNEWAHIAWVRSSGSLFIYVNGVRQLNQAAATFGVGATNLFYIGDYFGQATTNTVPHYQAGIRFVKGTAVYTTATITVPTAPLAAITNTQLLCNFTNAGIYDGTMNNVFETVGNAQISTAVVKYGSGALYFDGTGDYLRNVAAPVSFLQWWRGEYTIEYWIYPLAFTQGGNSESVVIGDMSPTTTGNYWSFGPITNGTVKLYYFTGTGQSIATTQTISTGQWTHLAMVQRQGIVYIYINGVLSTSAAYSGTPQAGIDASNYLVLGSANNASFNGYLDDVRITLAARYTRNFTPPQAALPRQ